MKSSNRPDDLLHVGTITGAHGIKGAVKVYSSADALELYHLHDDLILMDTTGCKLPHKVVWAQPYKKGVRLAFDAVTNRNQAEALVGCALYIPKDRLPELDADTNYWDDLIGMAVYTETGEHLGRLSQIIPTGANDVYVVQKAGGSPADEILLPAIASVILSVDVDGKRMEIKIPEGLLD